MVESGLLSDQFGAASLMNFVVFVVFVRKHRRSRLAAPFTGRLADLLEKLRHGVVTFLAAVLRGESRRIIRNNPGIEDRQIPSRKRQRQMDNQLVPTVDPRPLQVGPENQERKNKKKKTVMADLNTIWNLLAEAQECKVSLAVLLRTKKKEVGGGSSEATVDYWGRKMQAMYMARASLACTGLTHFNLLTDAARFSTDETIVSIVYSPESDFAAFLNNQKVKGGGKEIMHPNDFPMEPGIERLAAERRVGRLASYRLLQALSNQLKHVTNNSVTLASFLVDESSPSGLILKPMSPEVLRIVQRDQQDNVSRVLLRNKRSGVATVVDALAGLREAKFLTLQMDQGPESFDPQPSLKSNCGLGVDVDSALWEPMVRSMLRTRSSEVVMQELALLAKTMNLDRQWRTREDLVRLLAVQVGGEMFATCVMEKEEQATKRGCPGNGGDDDPEEEDEAMDDLAELILGEMGADAEDFREMKHRLQNRHAERKKKKLARLARAKAKGVKKRKGKGKGKGRVKGRGKGKKRRLDDSGEPSVMRKLSFNDAAQGVPESVDGGATEPEAAASSVNPKAEVAEQTRLPTQESLEILKAIAELEFAGSPAASSSSAPSRPSAVSAVAPENGAVEDVVSAAEAVPASLSKDDSPGAPAVPAFPEDVAVVPAAPAFPEDVAVVPAAPDDAASQGGASHGVGSLGPRGPNAHSSPGTLITLSPPGCSILLDCILT
eukprot:symbB.v1.2.028391.t1/scaffold3007.1/size65499/1